jgi:hypothetical protein
VPGDIGWLRLTMRLMHAAVAAVVVAIGCTTIVDPSRDPRAEQFQPPAVYARWWTMTEGCSGLHGSLADVSTSFIPSLPLQSTDGGFFTLVVTARNPKDYPVFVLLNPPGWNRIFAYTLSGPLGVLGNIETSSDPGFSYFKPGESKQHYFDLNIGPALMPPRTPPTGSYSLTASYDDNRVTRENVQIGSTTSLSRSQQREVLSSRRR